jgi:serine/threonine-protein kinase
MADRQRPDDDLTRGPGAKPTRPPTTAVPTGLASTIAPGQLLGHTYRIESLLARGGMGEVYRARHAELNTEHAIKIILPELAGNQRIVDLFRREASVLRTIRHDAIVAYDGVFRDENARLYLVMEFVDGPSLSKVMKQGGLRPAQVRELRDRLADGLAAAHEKGVIHRDLSPDNVILPGGELFKAKIIDFGISKMADPEAKTIVGDDFAGKYSYVSPEQVGLYGGKVDTRSDIYSLGLVLAAAAGGAPLDMGSSPISVVEARRAVPKLDRVPAELRPELTSLLQPDPADRPQTMRELIREPPRSGRQAETARRPTRAATTTTARDAQPSGPGTRMAIIGGAVVLVLAIGGGLAWLLVPSPGPGPTPQPPTNKIALLTAAADAAVQGFQCANPSVHVSQSGDISVTGYVASPADKEQVTAKLGSLADAGSIKNQLDVMKWPLCEMRGILEAQTASRPTDPGVPHIEPGGELGTYFTNDYLKPIVTTTSLYDGYLYIDYVDPDGSIAHLSPNEARPAVVIPRGTAVKIGTLSQEKYQIKEPYGTGLLVAISTPKQLFAALRPIQEQGDGTKQYLAELRRQLQSVAEEGYQNSLVSSYSVLTLVER